MQIYLLAFGEYSVDNYGTAEWILYVVATIFIPLIMFNMIIAIMSDTFERVTTTMIEADGNELNSLVLEQENLYFWVRD